MFPARSVLVVIALGGLLFVASGQSPAKERGVLSVLQKGQPITLKDTGQGYELVLLKNGPESLSHMVEEVAGDFVVIKDRVETNEIRIPIYAIKSIVVTTLGHR